MNPIKIVERFNNHKPELKDQIKIDRHNDKGRELADIINGQCPDNREKAIALTKLEEAVMWANKSVMLGEERHD